VTVCIGAICSERDESRIVMCSDTRIGIPYFASSDAAGFKLAVIKPGILALFAGNVSRALELILRYQQLLDPAKLSAQSILDEIRYPAERQKAMLVDEYLRLHWSVTRDEYFQGILNNLPESDRARISAQIEQISLEASLIIATFIDRKPYLFKVQESGAVLWGDAFEVIGSGETIAYPALCQRQFSKSFDLPKALYSVYEAKKLSEVEPTVGPDTHIFILTPDNGNSPGIVPTSRLKDLDKLFRRFGPRPIPADLALPEGVLIGVR
jgi:hypothetical protein